MLDSICIDEGTIIRAHIDPATIVRHAIFHNASAVLLAHNHPNGIAIPSSDDIQSTYHLQSLLETLGITLLDHLIFADERYTSILSYSSEQAPTLVNNHFYHSYLQDHDRPIQDTKENK